MAKRKGLDKQFPVVVGILEWANEHLVPLGFDSTDERSVTHSAIYQQIRKEKEKALKNA
tara:strand:+ start:2518 stop:2694 length:177 start_codon:yes stop_codon:yes gene_type:complete